MQDYILYISWLLPFPDPPCCLFYAHLMCPHQVGQIALLYLEDQGINTPATFPQEPQTPAARTGDKTEFRHCGV